jgi:hypothetical protein
VITQARAADYVMQLDSIDVCGVLISRSVATSRPLNSLSVLSDDSAANSS